MFLVGDFNYPNIQWLHSTLLVEPASAEASCFLDVCSIFNLSQLVYQPTRVTPKTSSLLDLVLTSAPDIISSITHIPGLSDHDVLQFSLSLPPGCPSWPAPAAGVASAASAAAGLSRTSLRRRLGGLRWLNRVGTANGFSLRSVRRGSYWSSSKCASHTP